MTEDQIQASIVDYLRTCGPIGSLVHSIPNGAVLAGNTAQRGRQMAKLKWTGLLPGAADLLMLWNGRAIYLEVKKPKQYQTDTQKTFQDDVAVCGGHYAVVRSIDDVQQFMDALGVPMRGRV
jgi:hypothetical protein